MRQAWWARGVDEVIEAVGSRREGLTPAEARSRLALALPLRRGGRTAWRILATQFLQPLSVMLIVAAAISIAVGASGDGLVILAIVAVTGGLGFYQENQAERVVERLLALVRVGVTVRRDGRELGVPQDQVVPGDVVVLRVGSMIPADARLVRVDGLQVDESPLTGEPFPAEKQVEPVAEDAVPSARRSGVFLGTHVVSGTGEAIVVAVGRDTVLGHLSGRLAKPRPRTDFDRGLQRFGYLMLQVTIGLVLVIFAVNVLLDRPVLGSFLFSVAIAVGLTPELLPAIVTVNLARGAHRMAEAEVVIKHLSAIENLGAVDVLCSDKTGTLTEGRVRLDAALAVDGGPSARTLELGALNATLESGYANPLDAALRDAWSGGHGGWRRIGEVAYDFARKRLSILIERDGRRLLVTKGQLGSVLDACSTVEWPDGTVGPIDTALAQITRLHADQAANGRRVLGVAVRDVPVDAVACRELETDLMFVGLLTFTDPPRADAARVLHELGALGVEVKVLTGDDRRVAAYVWRELRGEDPVVLCGAQVQALPGHALDGCVGDIDVFAEMEPQQKERVVHALRRRGHVVAYIGDGINDAAALHAADVGVSVDGAADIAREAADVVLRRHDLGVIANGIREGRRTMVKTLVYVRYTTSANFGNMMSMAVASLGLPFLPLLPKQILLNNLLSDLPAIAIPGDRVDDAEIARPGRWSTSEIRQFMFVFGSISTAFDLAAFAMLVKLGDGNPTTFQSGWFVVSLLTELLVLIVLRTRRPIETDPPGRGLTVLTLAVAAVALALPFTPLAPLFSLAPLTPPVLIAVLGIALGYVATTELAKRAFFRPRSP